jgi:capsular exopolysaccharide synthesis family protein
MMVTSAVESEGKSTTIANLAVAMARAGRRVCLVDIDLRRPYVANFFGLVGAAGLTDVALGHIGLDRALHTIAVVEGGPLPAGAHGISNEPTLDVLPSGPLPPNPGEFIESQALAAILQDLRLRYDVVLVDAPPMLSVGDPLALSNRVDGIVLIARMKIFRRPMANELRRAIGAARARVLGVIVTGAEADDGYGYGYGYGYGQIHGDAYSPREAEHV